MDEILRQLGPFVYLAIVIIGGFIARTLKQIDRNQTELWRHMDAHETRRSDARRGAQDGHGGGRT